MHLPFADEKIEILIREVGDARDPEFSLGVEFTFGIGIDSSAVSVSPRTALVRVISKEVRR